jgi:hypothetical protein
LINDKIKKWKKLKLIRKKWEKDLFELVEKI